jgi:hypothetical protein
MKLDNLNFVVFSFVFLFILSTTIFALNIDVVPGPDDNPSIEDVSCGSDVSTQYTITNTGSGGVLCWYWTSDDSSIRKLTTSCIGESQTKSYDAVISMPTSGTRSTDLQLECYDFWSLSGDKCKDSTEISEARADHYSGGAEGIMSVRQYSLSCKAIDFTITPSATILDLLNSESETITITVKNQMTESITCDQGIGSISAGGSNTNYKLSITTPSTGSGTKYETASVTCSWSGGTSLTQTSTITVNYQSNPCVATLSNANNAIVDTETEIINANNKITEANNLGADITTAQTKLNEANAKLTTARTESSTAQISCDSGDTINGQSQANTAKNSANIATEKATEALNSAQQSITVFKQLTEEASNKKSSAYSAIDTTKKSIKEAEDLISNATVLGMDTTQAEANIATARTKLKSAEDYYTESTSAFEIKNYELSKDKATTSESYAKDAETMASSAYNSLWTIYSKKRVGAETILTANAQVSKMNEIMTKMEYVLRNIEESGIDISTTKSVVDEAKISVDEAEDVLSEAKNKFEAGYTEQSADLAVQAKTNADTADNRLDTIVLNLKFEIQDALEIAYKQKQANIEQTKNKVQSASESYGADNELVIDAQKASSDAETSLSEAELKINSIETSESLTELLANAEDAFTSLEQTQVHMTQANTKADEASGQIYQTIAVGATGVAIAGGGFLYWRKKKKTKHKSKEKKKVKK